MDSDAFYPAFVTAARVLGLGQYAVKALEAEGIRLKESNVKGGTPLNVIGWVENVTKKVRERIYGEEPSEGIHQLMLEAVGEGLNAAQLLLFQSTTNNAKSGAQLSLGGLSKLLFEVEGEKSDFLQLNRERTGPEGKVKVPKKGLSEYGYGTFKWATTSAQSFFTLPHNLEAIPNKVLWNAAFPNPPDYLIPIVTKVEKASIEFAIGTRTGVNIAAGTVIGYYYDIAV